VMFEAMYAHTSTWSAICAARPVRRTRRGSGAQPTERPDAPRLATLIASSRPMEIAAIRYGGRVLILWPMVLKPFYKRVGG
jgi:hypothetical protein